MTSSRPSPAAGLPALLALLLGCTCGACPGAEAPASSGSLAAGAYSFAIAVAGSERRYTLQVPAHAETARSLPLVMMFHGGGGTAHEAMWETGWAEKAGQDGFLAVFPEGTAPDATRPARFRDNPQTWNDGSGRAGVGAVERGVDDVGFVAALLADVQVRCRVDGRRIYATGFSNGASMSFRLARELSRLIAAVAPVAGGDWLERAPERPVPLLYITGTADPLNPIAGGEVRLGLTSFGVKPPVQATIDRWVDLLGCPRASRLIYDAEGARGMAYGLPGGVPPVVLYTIDGHGHHWPGGRSRLPEGIAGRNLSTLKATDIIWEFFKEHPLPEGTAVPGNEGRPRR